MKAFGIDLAICGRLTGVVRMRVRAEKERGGLLIRLFGRNGEIAYIALRFCGLMAEVEFPSDWHEQRRAWVRIGLGIGQVCFSFPWSRVVPDEYQCSGPTYGFQFYEDLLWIRWGKSTGRPKTDPSIAIYMPWSWKHREHVILSEKESHPYTYTLRSGAVQHRTATINAEMRRWTRWWLPYKRVVRSINIDFDKEVGERSGSWKGGVLGCGYDMLPNETPLDTLRRMERERVFR